MDEDKKINSRELTAGFIWTEEYGVGIEEIDAQHKRFFEIANSILELEQQEGFEKEELLKRVAELGNYALYHLETEEGYFDKYGYEGAAAHVAAHDEFRQKAKEYISEAQSEGADAVKVAETAAAYAGQWLLKHILFMDKQYTKFFQEKGLK